MSSWKRSRCISLSNSQKKSAVYSRNGIDPRTEDQRSHTVGILLTLTFGDFRDMIRHFIV